MFLNNYSQLFKLSYLLFIVPTLCVIITAWLSAKEMGGNLGQGLKKIAVGSILDTILLMTYLLLEKGNMGLLTEEQIRIFFIASALVASILLIIGYIQIYKITRKLRLFA